MPRIVSSDRDVSGERTGVRTDRDVTVLWGNRWVKACVVPVVLEPALHRL
jgi:hypothetical protein